MRKFAACLLMLLCVASGLRANPYAQNITLQVLPGWRMENGQHMAGLRLQLADGWKTYWRAPGDAGIPPLFDWSGSDNIAAIAPQWPTPRVFWLNGMRSIGYKRELVLPLAVTPQREGAEMRLRGHVQLGICNQICVPVDLQLDTVLPAVGQPDPLVQKALRNRPAAAADLGIHDVTCDIMPTGKGMELRAAIALPRLPGIAAVVVETADPDVWVAEAELQRSGAMLRATTQMMHLAGGAFMLDRSGLRLTVLAEDGQAVDIRGCPAP